MMWRVLKVFFNEYHKLFFSHLFDGMGKCDTLINKDLPKIILSMTFCAFLFLVTCLFNFEIALMGHGTEGWASIRARIVISSFLIITFPLVLAMIINTSTMKNIFLAIIHKWKHLNLYELIQCGELKSPLFWKFVMTNGTLKHVFLKFWSTRNWDAIRK